jgi:PadR family transcriptional regulator, regulatory protein PadR
MLLTHALVRLAQALVANPDQRHWGYDLSRQSGVRSGVLYPILSHLLEQGWVTDGWEDRAETDGRPLRRYYRLTDTGRTELAALLERARGDRRFQNI